MTQSIDALLSKVIDYAGMFPPASLSFEQAVHEYKHLLKSKKRWILNRFICPISHLERLAYYLNQQRKLDEKWEVAVIGAHYTEPERDIELIQKFEKRCTKGHIAAYEVKAKIGHVDKKDLLPFLHEHNSVDEVYIEIPWIPATDEWPEPTLDSVQILSYYAENLRAKARLGGTTTKDIPAPVDVARFLLECNTGELSYKLTAGLHHPLYAMHNLGGKPMHGFINLLVAGAFAQELDATHEELEAIITESDISQFLFLDDEFSWKDLSAPADTIKEFRQIFTSFGSCSIDEPLEGLLKLGLIEPEDIG